MDCLLCPRVDNNVREVQSSICYYPNYITSLTWIGVNMADPITIDVTRNDRKLQSDWFT